MEADKQARLIKALKDRRGKVVEELAEEPLPLTVVDALADAFHGAWCKASERALKTIAPVARRVDPESRRRLMLQLLDGELFDIFRRCLEADWCPSPNEALVRALLHSDNYKTTSTGTLELLENYFQKHGHSHKLLQAEGFLPQNGRADTIRSLYRTALSELPADTTVPRIFDSRNAYALQAALKEYGREAISVFLPYEFPASTPSVARDELFYRTLFEELQWTEEEITQFIEDASQEKEEGILRGLLEAKGRSGLKNEQATEFLQQKLDEAVSRTNAQQGLVALGAGIPEDHKQEILEELLKRTNPEALRTWVRQFGFSGLLNNDEFERLTIRCARDPRMLQVLYEEGVDLSSKDLHAIAEAVVGAYDRLSQELSDSAAFQTLTQFENFKAQQVFNELIEADLRDDPFYLECVTALVQEGVELDLKQTNYLFRAALLGEEPRFSLLQALSEQGYRPSMECYNEVIETVDKPIQGRLEQFVPNRAKRSAQQRRAVPDN